MGIFSNPYNRFKQVMGRSPKQQYGQYSLNDLFNAGSVKVTPVGNEGLPLEEIAVNTLAKHCSLLKIEYYDPNTYDDVTNTLANALKLRPNEYMNPVDFWHNFFYQVFKYNHGIAIPIYTKNTVVGFEILDLAINELLFIGEGKSKELAIKYENEYKIINYNDIIHIRNHPQSYFYNESYIFPTNCIPEIIDENLTTYLTEIRSNYDIRGILSLGEFSENSMQTAMTGEDEKQQAIDNFLKTIKSGIGVVDAGGKFTAMQSNFANKTVEDMKNLLDLYFSFYGIPKEIVFNNWTYEVYSSFYNSVLKQKMTSLEYELNYKIIATNKRKNEVIQVRVDQLSGIDSKSLVQFFATMRYQGVFSTNRILTYLGFKPVKDGDELIGNKNMEDPTNGILKNKE